MRRVLKTLFVHLFCILFFAFFYYYFSTHFNNTQHKLKTNIDLIIDFFLLSTTIQAGVGVSDILPVSVYGKLLMISQQLIMISISVITIYIFTK